MRSNWKSLLLALLAASLITVGWSQPSFAALVFFDDFGTTGAQGNWGGDSFFVSVPQPGNVQGLPSVDLVGPGFYDQLAYQGNSVDLDGSTGNGNNPAGQLQSIQSLALGDYTVSFLLAGNLRGYTAETTVVSIGNTSFSLTPLNTQGYTIQTLHFTGVSGNLIFADLGPSNQQGNLIDNVTVTTGVPEASTWIMMLLGFAGIGLYARRRSQKALATA